MNILKFLYYQEKETNIGWFEDYPDYLTRGKDLDELKENLKDIYADLNSGIITQVR